MRRVKRTAGLAAFVSGAWALGGCAAPATVEEPAPAAAEDQPISRVTLSSGLLVEDFRAGSGAAVLPGSLITVRYRGTLAASGEVFDETPPDQTRTYELERLIEGWRQGLIGMRVGGRRRLHVPPSLAYGAAGYEPLGIPPGASLVFDIELIAVR